MDFAGHIAGRYLRSRRHSRFLSRGSVTAIVGIAIGVMVLNVTLAVMNGFHAEMRRTFVENMPMVSVITSAPEGFQGVGAVMDSIGTLPAVTGVRKVLTDQFSLTRSFYLVRHEDDRRVGRLNRFAALLSEGVRREVARLERLT